MPNREWVQSDRRAENPEIKKEEDELGLYSWIQIRSTGAPGLKTASISLKNPEGVRGGEKAGGVERDSHEQESVLSVQREKIQNGWKGDKRLEARVERKCYIRREGDGTMEVYKQEESEEEVTVLEAGTQQGGSSKSSEFGGE